MDPAPVWPGMSTMRLDPQGRLLHYQTVPPGRVEVNPRPMDWDAVLAAAGLDPRQLKPASPILNPPVHATSTRAWTFGTLRLEAAERHRRLAWFTTLGPSEQATAPDSAPPRTPLLADLNQLFFRFILPGLSLVLAYRNWRRGRIDLRGANRLGACVLACGFPFVMLQAHHHGALQWEAWLVVNGLRRALYHVGGIWLGYLAVEPFVRRRWPDALISWTRLLSGRILDPRVGRDLLIGLGAGWGAVSLLALANLARGQVSAPKIPPAGFAIALSWLSLSVSDAILYSLSATVLLLVFRVLARRTWLSYPLLILAVSLLGVSILGPPRPHLADFAVCGVIGLSILALLTRLGFVALLAFFIPTEALGLLSANPGRWDATVTILFVGLTAALGLFALKTSVGDRPLFGTAGED